MEQVEIIDDIKRRSYCCFGKILQRKVTFDNGAYTTNPFCSICGKYPPMSQKAEKRLQKLCELLNTAEKQQQLLIELGVSLTLPEGFNSRFEELPDQNTEVIVFTNLGKNIKARFQTFIDAEIWETDGNFEENEVVIGWRYKL